VLTVNLSAVMVLVLLVHGHVMAGMTVQTVQTKLIAVAMTVVLPVLTANLTAVMVLVLLVHGHVMAGMTVEMVQTKLIAMVAMMVVQAVLTVNLTVAMVLVLLVHGHVMAGRTVEMVQTKLIVLLNLVKTKVYGIVAMANVYLQLGYVMVMLLIVTHHGVLTVIMVQMKD
jgi:hypothetical protein